MKDYKKNYNSINLVKFIMSIVVVAIHTIPVYNIHNDIVINVYTIFTNLAVPFFFIASGFLIGIKLDNINYNNNIKLIKKQLFKILKMYIIWSFIYAPLAIYEYVTKDFSFIEACIAYIKGFIFVGEHFNSWHLWYLLSTVYALLVIIFFLKRKFTIKKILCISFLVSIISVCISFISNFNQLCPAINFIKTIINNTIINGRILNGIVYIPLGIYLSKKEFSKFLTWLCLIISFILSYIISFEPINYYFLIIMSISFFEIIKNINLKDNKFFQLARTSSTIIYLIHMYVWTLYYTIFYGKITFGFGPFVITSIISIIISFIYIYIKQKKKVQSNF